MKEYKGYNGNLIITDTGIKIVRGAKGFFFGGGSIRGDKSIPFKSIGAVQFKKSGFTVGYIQFSVNGGVESTSGVLKAIEDENTVTFMTKKTSELFEEAKEIIESKIHSNQSSSSNLYDDIENLAKLKEQGFITAEEFDQKKKSILGL